ncbi:MAG TPA: PLP-dependent aminotransferase family protein [Cytophagaceae bacterium]
MGHYSSRMDTMPVSFLREILKAANSGKIISFAGGLPDESLFPGNDLKNASIKVLEEQSAKALQYTVTEGYQPLREWIAERYYKTRGMTVSPSEILITSGSQQALDLIGKVFINKGDPLLMEGPGYLGAIQAFSAFEPTLISIPVNQDGIDIPLLEKALLHNPKLLYLGSSFQNPTSICYSENIKNRLASQLASTNTFIVEDDAYGELSFDGTYKSLIKQLLPDKTILLGSFSKIISPGLRIGWIVAEESLIRKLTLAKQATDLHSSNFNQMLICQYLKENNPDKHINTIRQHYQYKMQLLYDTLCKALPPSIAIHKPEGGMFIYLNLPPSVNADELLDKCLKHNLVFVPGKYFFPDPGLATGNGIRVNFSCVPPEDIIHGGTLLGRLISEEVNTSS